MFKLCKITIQTKFQLEFEAIGSSADNGHVAIDDINIVRGQQCPIDGLCDFQVGLCKWSNMEGDDGDWIVSSNGMGNMDIGTR